MAGFIDAIVGGGGLIQLPALFILQPHLTLVNTLASNKMASLLGTSVATGRYLQKVKINWKQLTPSIFSAFAGSLLGGILVSKCRKEYFMPVIICALVAVLLFTLMRKNFGLHHIEKQMKHHHLYIYAIGTGFVIGLYDGLIGPGTGSFLVFAFILFFGYDFLHASAHAKVINCVTNFAALIFFFYKGYILWTIAIPVGLANMAGNYAGSHLALKKGSGFIRFFFIAVVSVLIIKLGYDYAFKK